MVLTKEYRIPLPLTVDEYRIAQLYMIAKKSRMESHDEGGGVQILVNEPYTNGPGPTGKGQYTRKVYYVASHLPGWLKALVSKNALTVEEEAWNAYPYTKTRFTCSFVQKFSIDIETVYTNDGGHQDNVFELSDSERKRIESDLIDIVKDQTIDSHYLEAEDPKLFKSSKTGRGPLQEDWIQDYWAQCEGQATPTPEGKALMCAYKLCKVEFQYWGMQSKIEKFIHDVVFRKTMCRAHSQAWAWMDEWWGLTIDDIRAIERETMVLLQQKYATQEQEDGDESAPSSPSSTSSTSPPLVEVTSEDSTRVRICSQNSEGGRSSLSVKSAQSQLGDGDRKAGGRSSPYGRIDWSGSTDSINGRLSHSNRRSSWQRSVSRNTLSSHSQASWRMESIRRNSYSDESGEEDDEFYDCVESSGFNPSMCKWSSLELLGSEPPTPEHTLDAPLNSLEADSILNLHATPGTPHSLRHSPVQHCSTSILIIVLHAGSVLETTTECSSKGSDLATFRHTFECVVRQHYPVLSGGGIAFRLVPVQSVTSQALQLLSSLSSNASTDGWVPVGALPVIADGTPQYAEAVQSTHTALQTTYRKFLISPEGIGFSGHVCIVGDCVAGLLLYDVLCKESEEPTNDGEETVAPTHHPGLVRQMSEQSAVGSRLNSPMVTRRESTANRLEYESCDVFLLGCPLGLILMRRKIHDSAQGQMPVRPKCHQLYNLFHPTDPLALRLEPLLAPRMANLPPVTIPRYTKHPLGDNQPTHLLEYIQRQHLILSDTPHCNLSGRRTSDASMVSTVSGLADSQALATGTALREVWWGGKRLDFALYCPEGLANFPSNSLPHLFHASFWESSDVAAFILRQVIRTTRDHLASDEKELPVFMPTQPREKWIKKRTSVKIKNVTANHRANDVIVKFGSPQVLHARFMYGPLDMVALSGERVDIHVMRSPPAGEWALVSSHITDKTGRLAVTLPKHQEFATGVYPVKMVVRGDHTSCLLWLAVVPPQTQFVVFSIDGSLTASVSVSGKDPKVRPGAVDVLRAWQQKGYLLLYITGRPDLQQHRVLSWLAKHNFPHGLVSFAEGITTDPLGHKATYLKGLMQDQGVMFQAAYGSSKDITVYSGLGLNPDQIYVVGRANKKQHSQAQVLSDGYSAHLSQLTETLRPALSQPQLSLSRNFIAPNACYSIGGKRIWTTTSVNSSPCPRRSD